MSDSTIGFLVEDCVNHVLEGYRNADAEACQIAQSQQDDRYWELFMQSWLGKPLTSLAEKAYDIGAAEANDYEILCIKPIDDVVSKIEDAIWAMSKDCNDSTEWWDINHHYARRTGETFASRLMVNIKSIIEQAKGA